MVGLNRPRICRRVWFICGADRGSAPGGGRRHDDPIFDFAVRIDFAVDCTRERNRATRADFPGRSRASLPEAWSRLLPDHSRMSQDPSHPLLLRASSSGGWMWNSQSGLQTVNRLQDLTMELNQARPRLAKSTVLFRKWPQTVLIGWEDRSKARPKLIKSPLDRLAWVQKGKRETPILFDNGSQELTLPAGLVQVHDDVSVLSICNNKI